MYAKRKENEKKVRIRVRARVKQIEPKLVTMEIGIMIAVEWKPTLFYTLFSLPPPPAPTQKQKQKKVHL